MSIKELFNRTTKVIESAAENATDTESSDFVESSNKLNETYVPNIDYTKSFNYIKFGSATLYYTNAIKRIYGDYPYDGSFDEKNHFELESSGLDKWMLDYKYPKVNGYVNLGKSGYVGSPTIISDYEHYNSEYIYLAGGIRPSEGMTSNPLHKSFDKSGVYDESTDRIRNLSVDFTKGSTIEFWMKKDTYVSSGKNEVVFDLWNGESSSSSDYGRMTIEVNNSTANPFYITLYSGPNGFVRQNIASSVGPTFDWTHFAFTFSKNSSAGIDVRLYVNGQEDYSATHGGSVITKIPKTPNAHIGALMANAHGNTYHNSDNTLMKGYGKLLASMDEFRFWKTKRTSREIRRDYCHPIGGGQNKKDSDNSMRYLGVYYKFNEGITGDDTIDATVLDYSGRIVNGTWIGYPGSSARSVDSAMVLSQHTNEEPKDPIIYPSHPSVVSLLSEMESSGSTHERQYGSYMYDMIPSWIREEDEINNNIKNVIHIMATYFDSLHAEIEGLTKTKEKRYYEIDKSDYRDQPPHFAKRRLLDKGFHVAELFPNSTVLEYFMQRDKNNLKFKFPITTVKNLIYQNIYNNLENIYRSKGTEGSFRNLFRCFGVDDELLKLNIYTDHGVHYFRDNVRHTSHNKKYINFHDPTRYASSIYVTSSANNPNTYIDSIVGNGENSSFTYEVDMIAPKKYGLGSPYHITSNFTKACVFGQHEPASSSDLTWHATDNCDFIVYTDRPENDSRDAQFVFKSEVLGITLKSDQYEDVYDNQRWNLAVRAKPEHYEYDGGIVSPTNPNYIIEFYGVNFALDIVQNEFFKSATVSYAKGKSFVESAKRTFVGAHLQNFTGSTLMHSDVKIGSLRLWIDHVNNDAIKQHALDPSNYGPSQAAYSNATMFTKNLESFHIPRYDTLALSWDFDNVTGSDGTGNYTVFDLSSGSSDTIYGWVDSVIRKNHDGYGYGFPTSSVGMIDNEVLMVSKKNLPEIAVSSDRIYINGDEEKYLTKDDDISDNFYSIEKSMPQIISEEMLNTLSSVKEFSNLIGRVEDRYRDKYKRLEYLRQMFFQKVSGDIDFEQFIEYYKWIDSALNMMIAQLLPISSRFSKEVSNMVENHIFERSKYRNKIPTFHSYDIKEGHLKGINENSWKWKHGHAPLSALENENCLWWEQAASRVKDIKTSNSTIDTQRENIRNIKTSVIDASSYDLAKPDKTVYQGYTSSIRRFTGITKMTVSEQQIIHAGTNYDRRKDRNMIHNAVHIHGRKPSIPMNQLLVFNSSNFPLSGITSEKNCSDNLNPALGLSNQIINKKAKKSGTVAVLKNWDSSQAIPYDYYGQTSMDFILPFSVYSSSVPSGVDKIVSDNFLAGIIFTNLHSDTYGITNDISLQSPFTNQWVGGHQHRHVELNKTSDTNYEWSYDPNTQQYTKAPTKNLLDGANTRPEAWRLLIPSLSQSQQFAIVGPDYGGPYPDPRRNYAHRYREERTKRPINIKNIKIFRPTMDSIGNISDSVSKSYLGNYFSNYEIVQYTGTNGAKREMKNRNLLGSLDVSKYENGLLPEAMSELGSFVHPLTKYPHATHSSALYGRRPSWLHNDGNVFLRQPRHTSEGASSDINYAIVFREPDTTLLIRHGTHSQTAFTQEYMSKSGLNDVYGYAYSSWFMLADDKFTTQDEYCTLFKFGDQNQANKSWASNELNIWFSKTELGVKKFRFVFKVTNQSIDYPAEWTSQETYDLENIWSHVVLIWDPRVNPDATPSIYVDGKKVSLVTNDPLDSAMGVFPKGDSYLFYDGREGYINDGKGRTPIQYKGLVGDAAMLIWSDFDDSLSKRDANRDKIATRLYNRGLLVDPKLLKDKFPLFWFTMTRNPHDSIDYSSSPYKVDKIYDTVYPSYNDRCQLVPYLPSNMAGKNQPFSWQYAFSSTTTDPPKVADTSGYIWEYSFENYSNTAETKTESDSFIINRFSAPGGPEINGKSFLDIPTRQFSVYNAMPWRNTSVLNFSSGEESGIHVVDHLGDRMGLKTHLTRHCGKFGLDSVNGEPSHVVFPNIKTNPKTPFIQMKNFSSAFQSSEGRMTVSFYFKLPEAPENPTVTIFNIGDPITAGSGGMRLTYNRTARKMYFVSTILGSTSHFQWETLTDLKNTNTNKIIDMHDHWRHVVLTWDLFKPYSTHWADPILYVDSERIEWLSDKIVPFPANLKNSMTGNFVLGSDPHQSHPASAFVGSFAEFGLWRYALSHDEVKKLYIGSRKESGRRHLLDSGLDRKAETWIRMGDIFDPSTPLHDMSPSGLHSDTFNNIQFQHRDLQKPSYFKQHRNTLHRKVMDEDGRVTIKQTYDNANVNTPIPRSDFQYSWIRNAVVGQQQNNHRWQDVQHMLGHAPPSGMLDVKYDIPTSVSMLYVTNPVDNTGLYRGRLIGENCSDFATSKFTFSFWAATQIFPGESIYVYFQKFTTDGTSLDKDRLIQISNMGNGKYWLTIRVPTLTSERKVVYELTPSDNWRHYVISFAPASTTEDSFITLVDGVRLHHVSHLYSSEDPLVSQVPGNHQMSFLSTYNLIVPSRKGLYREFAFYNTNLTLDQCATIYNNRLSFDHKAWTPAANLKAWYRFNETHDHQGEAYITADRLGSEVTSYTQLGYKINDRSNSGNDLAAIDWGPGKPNMSFWPLIDLEKEYVQKTNYVEAIVFPSVSEIVGV
tara:strand:+ start:27265 stop:35250 length:7986 start_codon:yes stop_codon:yes gene_type:complete